MIVLDTAAAVDYLLDHRSGAFVAEHVEQAELALAPHLLDAEVVGVLRRDVAEGEIEEARAIVALAHLAAMRIVRFPHLSLMPRVWELRATVTTSDALFVALAEESGVPLVTTDRRLARTRGHRATIIAP
ncbi:MAG: type II toxin-antitoxin system VapC family toxin [Gaiella sp.]